MTHLPVSRRTTRLAVVWLGLMLLLAAAQIAWLWHEATERRAEAALVREAPATGARTLPPAAASAGPSSPMASMVSGAASSGASAATAADVGDREASPRRRFARAQALAASGRLDEAQALYSRLHSDTPLGQAARLNSANLLVAQAVEWRAGAQAGQALPALELAKALYRDILRADPGHWAARYNLERAQRLLPEPEPSEEADPLAPRQRERAATTARGQSQGMP